MYLAVQSIELPVELRLTEFGFGDKLHFYIIAEIDPNSK